MLQLPNSRLLASTRVVRQFDDSNDDDDVSERHEGVEGAWKQNAIAKEAQQIIASLLSMFHSLLDGLVDTIAVRITSDRTCRHSLVEPYNEGIHRDANQDDPESAGREVGKTEGEYEAIREHEQPIPDCLNLRLWEVQILENGLNGESKNQEPPRCDLQLGERGEASARDNQNYGYGGERDEQ